MTLTKYLLPLLLVSGSLFAQQLSHPVMVSRDDAFSSPRPYIVQPETVNVLAVMVQFQIDNDAGTSGNGQFDLSTPANPGLDAPPRNHQYFLDHLTFLTNYYRKASKGKVIIQATLVDSVFTLGSQMARYSPPKSGPNTAVGDLARDSWQKVDSSGLVPDFSVYDCFVVFHAGVGRDVDVAGTIGYDPTPRDIPSLYLGLNAFKEFYGGTYEGIPVRNGFRITNSIIMPETETRELPATPTNFTLTLGINGLLCASVGNFLGLPDLFDTNTGRSGIGRFGLMDGQAIFSFRGAFPPEPSAWEKYWLGWIQPVTLGAGEHAVSLPAVSTADTVYRIPISASEYFLVENRNRDAGRNGQRITTRYGGTIRQLSFARDTAGFEAFDISGISGNIIDVEDLDWSLPGGVNRAGTFYDGGVLIWHIDETVIAQGLATNGVNANPRRRGVNLMEADGSQDIGQQYGQLEPGSGSEEGTALDFWYLGNESPVNKNEFSAKTYPNSNSNSGANSHITIKDFSARGPQMTARVIVGGDQIMPLPGFPKATGERLSLNSLTIGNIVGGNSPQLVVSTDGVEIPPLGGGSYFLVPQKIYAWQTNGKGVVPTSHSGLLVSDSGLLAPASLRDMNGDGYADIVLRTGNRTRTRSEISVYSAPTLAGDSLATKSVLSNPFFHFTRALAISDSVIVSAGEVTYFFRHDGSLIDSLPTAGATGVAVFTNPDAFIVTSIHQTIRKVTLRLGANAAIAETLSASFYDKIIVDRAVVGIVGRDQKKKIAFTTTDGLYLLDENLNVAPGFPVNIGVAGTAVIQSPVVADIDGDGIRDIVAFSFNRIHAINYAGASLDNFPKLIPSSAHIRSVPVVADVDGDGLVDVVAVTGDGLVVAYNKNGDMARGFPLLAGNAQYPDFGQQSVAAFASGDTMMLAVASSEDGTVSAWRTGFARGAPIIPWGQFQRDAQHSGLAIEPLTGTPLSSSFFPKERAYNWPNPVYDGRTFIRYFVSENATVKIRIFDLAGDLVTEFNGPGIAGVDNEVEWNVRDVQSGVYLARIEASGSGKSETAIVKVAVVK
ncbi:MAG: T9SS type A sorting domain-containing protein [Bacteroidetes bacterium]|nr:T9SS type A sorting domain-containing protein [Bacteroidota bacterium]MCW5894198.1 T9SS type A sorting domain-containing protein [Bacteroidota bacterium]